MFKLSQFSQIIKYCRKQSFKTKIFGTFVPEYLKGLESIGRRIARFTNCPNFRAVGHATMVQLSSVHSTLRSK